MKVSFFSTKQFEREVFESLGGRENFDFHFLDVHLNMDTAVLAKDSDVVCAFVTDRLDRSTLEIIARGKTRLIALRSAGFNHVDLKAAAQLGLKVVRVPAYSPNAIAEYTVGLMLSLNRKIHKAYNRVREGNFSLDGLVGFDFSSRTIGVVGTGLIGQIVAKIMVGFGAKVVAADLAPKAELTSCGVGYHSVGDLLTIADVVTLHCPLTSDTRHLINERSLATMRKGAMLINTGRGALIDTPAVIAALKTGRLGSLGLDVYEEEEALFFEDHSAGLLADDVFARLLTFPNVLVTGHQAFLTHEALAGIARTTLASLGEFRDRVPLKNEVVC